MNRRVDRFDIPARLAALRDFVGADAEAIDLAEWAVRCLGEACFHFPPGGLDGKRDPLRRLNDGKYQILLDRLRCRDLEAMKADIAFGVARYWLRDVADSPDFAHAVHALAEAIFPLAASVTRVRVAPIVVADDLGKIYFSPAPRTA